MWRSTNHGHNDGAIVSSGGDVRDPACADMNVRERTTVNGRMFAMLLGMIIASSIYLSLTVSGRQAALFCVGALIGVAAYHSDFSFSATWRALIAERRSAGLRAQAWMLAIAIGLFVPALSVGSLLGMKVSPAVAPISVSVLIGAFVSGVGMQLSSRCACGTLYTASGLSSAMITTLAAFVAGSVLATAHIAYWNALPSVSAISLLDSFGAPLAIALSWTLLAAIVMLARAAERRRYGRCAPSPAPRVALSWFRGPWPLTVGACAFAALNFVTLAISGHAWRVTSAFALWGAKAARTLGAEPVHWTYWTRAENADALASPIVHDVPSVMNIGIMLGAMIACALAGRFKPVWRIPLRPWLATTAGGLLLGYGARLAFGSNVGAYFSGIASASLHGWLWGIAAFAGSIAGIQLRPLFGLSREANSPKHDC